MRIGLVTPTYNEAENLPLLVRRLMALDLDLEHVIVDDASPDGTGRIADEIATGEPRFRVIHRTGKRGYSPACKEGLQWCIDRGYGIVGTIDADLSQDPDVLPQLVAAIEGGADVAIGSRYVQGGELQVDWGWFRRAVSKAGSSYARAMVGTDTRDCTSGYRLYRAAALAPIDVQGIHSEGYSFLIELLAALRDGGACIREVPITYVERQRGASKISKSIIAEALMIATGLGLKRLTGQRRKPKSCE